MMEKERRSDGAQTDQEIAKPVPLYKLFSFADHLDVLMMTLGSVGAIVHGMAMPVYYLFLASFLDVFGGQSSVSAKKVSEQCLRLIYLGFIVWAAAWTEVFCWTYTGERQALKIRSKYLEAILRQDIEQFDTKLQTGEIIESVSNDMLLIQNAVGEKMGNAIHFLATLLAGVIIGFSLIWQMSLVTLGIVPLLAAAAALQAFMITNISSKSQEAYGKAGVIAEQTIAQIRTVYSFVGETKAIQAYSGALTNARKLGYQIGFINGLGIGTLFVAVYGSFSLLVWFGSVVLFHGIANGSTILMTMFEIMQGGIALGQASLSFSAFSQAQGAAQKIFKVINSTPSTDKQSTNGARLSSLRGEIQFQKVDFVYPSRPDAPILRKFSLRIARGKSVALVGSSGSGKSTVIALIERFYDPTSGRILLDGHDIKSLQLKWLRMQLGLVSQEPVLFATTIKDNIMLGKANSSAEEIEDAAKFSHAHAFIEKFPHGYDTQVGEKGVQLSGGQKQRIALARAVLKNPSILLLDEATSALDSSSEKLIQEALDQFMTARTTIVVAHRLSTIQHVDKIVVLEKGEVVETGTHEELMSKEETGTYFKLVKLQDVAVKPRLITSVNKGTPNRSTPWFTPKSTPRWSIQSSPYVSPSLGALALSSELTHTIPDLVENQDSSADVKEGVEGGVFWRLVKLNAAEWPQALMGSFGCVLTGAVTPFLCLLIGSVATLFYSTDHHYVRIQVRIYAMYFVVLSLAGMVGFILQEYFWGYVSENLAKRVRQGMFSAILRNEIAWFDRDENNSTHLSARLASDASTVKTALGGRISLILSNLSLLVIACIISFVLSWKMTLVTLSAFPLAVLAAVAEKSFLKGYTGDVEKAHRRASTIAGEAISSIRTVAAFCAEGKITSLFMDELNTTKKQSLWKGQVSGFVFGTAKFLQFAGYCLSLWYGLSLVRHHEADPRDAVRVFFVLLVGALVVGDAIGIVPDLMKGGGALKYVFAIIDREAEIDPEDVNASCLDEVIGDVEFRKVHFSYPARQEVPILKGLDLKVPAGTSLALVGPSGCGKSTVVALIERFYDPVMGKVMVDGVDIRSFNVRSLRHHIGLVQQEPALFGTTIYDNILYGKPEATEAEVEAAARVANAHDFISGLPDGYRTSVGDRGVQLSGGQKQRVAIARAVLKNPAILLLDEATSALDAESEKVVQQALERLMRRRTVVVVAHRLSTIRNMTSIAVLQDGAVVEQGSHSQLLHKPSGVYARLVALQNR